MKDYPIASIVTGFATIVVAFVNALSGEPVAVIITWAIVGCVFLCEAFGRADWAKRCFRNKKWPYIVIYAVIVGIVVLAVYRAYTYTSIKIETRNLPVTEGHGGYLWHHVRIYNNGWKDVSCNVYLTDLLQAGTPVKNLKNTKVVLGGAHEPDAFAAKLIAKRGSHDPDYHDFELFAIKPTADEFAMFSDNYYRELDIPKLGPGKYVESVIASGTNCGPVKKTFTITYKGGSDATVED